MSERAKISKEATTALEWAFGAYADKDPGVPFDIIKAVDAPMAGEKPPTSEEIDVIVANLLQSAVHDGIGARICLGWCTYVKDGRFGIGVMGLGKMERVEG